MSAQSSYNQCVTAAETDVGMRKRRVETAFVDPESSYNHRSALKPHITRLPGGLLWWCHDGRPQSGALGASASGAFRAWYRQSK